MHLIRSKHFIHPNHRVLMQLVAAVVRQSARVQEFSLELKTTLRVRLGCLGARAAGLGHAG